MLEFALRQERAKYQKLQYGVEQTQQQAVNNGTQSSEGWSYRYPCSVTFLVVPVG